MTAFRAITVSVDYGDILAITLAKNARHFSEIVVVSTPADTLTAQVVASVPNARLHQTNAFYADGAEFNKAAALEEGFDLIPGKGGFLCILDADILLPPIVDFEDCCHGFLYQPRRRILSDPSQWHEFIDWTSLPLADDGEWAGYFQLFHRLDVAVFKRRPWYPPRWRHAGGADSEFQARWGRPRRIRLPFECLHLGEDGRNWCGRVTPYLDGTIPAEAADRKSALAEMLAVRKRTNRYSHEWIGDWENVSIDDEVGTLGRWKYQDGYKDQGQGDEAKPSQS